MPVVNRIGDIAPEMATWRRWMHENPEVGFACHKTAAYVRDRLAEFGITEVHHGIAETGIVALIHGKKSGPTIGLRADMDALPMSEETGLPHASQNPGAMHACGHDGHTAMLLGAAKYLAETRNFAGTVALIFQPAEEGGGGGEVMVQEGIMDRFDINEVYAIHNAPGLATGEIFTCEGPIMAAVDSFEIFVTGVGGHGAMPHECVDPIVAAAAMVQSIQTIVSRNHFALDDLVVSVTQIHAGSADNIIPSDAYINGTVRSFDPKVQALVVKRLNELSQGIAAGYGVTARLEYHYGYPATVNAAAQTAKAAQAAHDVVGEARVDAQTQRIMAAEDFAYMLNARPGSYLFLGQGDTAGVHHPAYDFNDEIAPVGASFFARLIEQQLPLQT